MNSNVENHGPVSIRADRLIVSPQFEDFTNFMPFAHFQPSEILHRSAFKAQGI
jgi:hypothetical protein